MKLHAQVSSDPKPEIPLLLLQGSFFTLKKHKITQKLKNGHTSSMDEYLGVERVVCLGMMARNEAIISFI